MTTATLPKDPTGSLKATQALSTLPLPGHYAETITGRFRTIPTRQLALAWWCYRESHISKRELRIVFAAYEMAERRRYGRTQDSKEKPVYKLEEIQQLVGGQGNKRAERDLLAGVRNLTKIGLVKITEHRIVFAKSIDDLTVGEGSAELFDDFLEEIPNSARTIPVPRRIIRFLAAGLGRAETAYVIAALIRSLFWHRESELFRTDGRIKGSWVEETFGVSRRAVSDARSHLIALGWLKPLEVPQWAANKYGVHDAINLDWNLSQSVTDETSTKEPTEPSPENVDNSIIEPQANDNGFASPTPTSDTQIASPYINKDTSTNTLNTNRLGNSPGRFGLGGRKKELGRSRAKPNIRSVTLYDLENTERLFELHRQAVELRLWISGRAGELDFLSLANRARTHGKNAGGLFFWLLKRKKTEFITLIDEEVAAARLREHFYGKDTRSEKHNTREKALYQERLSKEEMFVELVIQTARKHKIEDPYKIAKQGEGWSKKQWDDAYLNYRLAQTRRQLLSK